MFRIADLTHLATPSFLLLTAQPDAGPTEWADHEQLSRAVAIASTPRDGMTHDADRSDAAEPARPNQAADREPVCVTVLTAVATIMPGPAGAATTVCSSQTGHQQRLLLLLLDGGKRFSVHDARLR